MTVTRFYYRRIDDKGGERDIGHISPYHIDRCRMQVLYDKIGALRPRELVKQGYHVEHVMTLMLWRLEYYLLSQNHRWGVLSLDTLHPPILMSSGNH